MSVIPCKFYGTPGGCRYGDHCRFYHARGGVGGNPFGVSTFGGGVGQAQDLSARNQQNMETMIEMVKRDMVEWETGHMYPFSCYGPTGGKPNLPGFEEISPEELRFQFYSNNKVPVDLSRQMTVLQQGRMYYKQVPPPIRNILERVIVKGERIPFNGWDSLAQSQSTFSSPQAANSSIFGGGGSSGSGIFGSSQAQTQPNTGFPVFGGNATTGQTSGVFGGTSTSGVFGGSANTFGATSQPSIFGTGTSSSVFGGGTTTAQPQPQQSSVFGGSGQQSLFGGGGTTGGLFGSPNTSSSSAFGTSTFGNQATVAAQPQPGIFSSPQQQQTPFSSPPNTSIFGSSSTTQAQAPQQSIFGSSSPQPQSQFPALSSLLQTSQTVPQTSQPQLSSVFGMQPQQVGAQPQPQPTGLPPTGSFFGSSAPQQAVTPVAQIPPIQPGSFFGTPPSSGTSLFGQVTSSSSPFGGGGLSSSIQATVNQKYVYTDETELTPEELAAFQAPEFTLENIPLRPPPKSLCGT